jgi:hypothetical protein
MRRERVDEGKGWRWMNVAALLMLGVCACGSPSGAPEFTFEPEPYTIVRGPGGTPAAIAEDDGGLYLADQVAVLVQARHASDFLAWAEDMGFSVTLSGRPTGDLRIVGLRVPPGSARQAATLIARRPGVVEARPVRLGEVL